MNIILTVDSRKFSLNGIEYLKNYISTVASTRLTIFNCYDRADILLALTEYTDFTVNGETYGSVAELQAALLDVLYSRNSLGDAFVQNNIPKIKTFVHTGSEVNTTLVASLVNNQPLVLVSINKLETNTPVFVEVKYHSTKYIYLFLKGKGSYGGAAPDVLPADFYLFSILNVTSDDVINTPNSEIFPLGDTTGNNFWEVASTLGPYDLNDSGVEDENGNPRTYFFSYTNAGVLWFAQFDGTPGDYGVGETAFAQVDFIVITNDTVSPIPTLQQVTDAENTTTNPLVTYDPVNGNKVSYEAKGQRYTDPNGNTIYSEYPDDAAAGDAVYKEPAKTGVQIRAMLSDIPEHATEEETYAKTITDKTVVPAGLSSFQKVLTESPEQIIQTWYGTKAEYDALDALDPETAYYIIGDLSFMGVVNEDLTTTQDADSLNILYPDEYPTMFFVVAPYVSTGMTYIKLTAGIWMIIEGTISNPT